MQIQVMRDDALPRTKIGVLCFAFQQSAAVYAPLKVFLTRAQYVPTSASHVRDKCDFFYQ
jgi:hypothetical protein